MGWVTYTHAEIDGKHPRTLAVCDRCGMVYNHGALRWQYEWMGAKIANLHILVCPTCMDEHQEQLRQIILPRDPIPIEQPRVEPAISEMGIFPPQVTPGPYDVIPSWDITRIPGKGTLSNDRLTATAFNTTTNGQTDSYTFFSNNSNTDKRLFTVTFTKTQFPNSEDFAAGVANVFQDQILGGFNNYLGDSQNSIAMYGDGTIWGNVGGLQFDTLPFSFAQGDFALVAVDAGNKKIWFQKNGVGIWNHGGNANPATGVGSIDISYIIGPLYAACTLAGNEPNGPCMATLNCFPTETVLGFAMWGASNANTANLTALTNPIPPDVTDPTALNATATLGSSYFSINQDLGVN